MQVHRLSYKVKGFCVLNDSAIRWLRMVTEKAKRKFHIVAFWQKHGLQAAMDAYGVKRRTLYHWQALVRKGGGKPEALNEKSKRPHKVRRRIDEWPWEVRQKIRELRDQHPNLAKEKVHVFLKSYCREQTLPCPSISTIGNLIRDMGGLRRFPIKIRHNGATVPRKPQRKQRKPKHFHAEYPGHCGSFDTIEKIIQGSRRYVVTFTDVYSRFSLALATKSHASRAAKEFFDLVTFLFPFPFAYVLTDNGSEFMKEFDQELRRLHVTHWHTYPKTPKMNAHDERFNRTIQEEYIDYNEFELLEPEQFNIGLYRHLLWHNTERPHFGLNLQTPAQFITSNNPEECKMYLTNTAYCVKVE